MGVGEGETLVSLWVGRRGPLQHPGARCADVGKPIDAYSRGCTTQCVAIAMLYIAWIACFWPIER